MESKIENDLISEIKLTPIQAQVFLLVTCQGKMNPHKISDSLGTTFEQAQQTAKELMQLGAFIDLPDNKYEAMHPRFTAVNMYRKLCQRERREFKKNNVVDNIGIILEKYYDDARTK